MAETKATKTSKGKDKIYYLPKAGAKESKKTIVWLVLGLVMIIIFATWVFFVRAGLIFPKSSAGGGLSQLTNSFKQLFANLKNDYSDIKANMKEDQEVKQLENKVFPQFSNTNK